LYGSKGMCSKALAIWCILARNYGAGLWKSLSENGSHETLGDKKSGEGIAAIEVSKILKTSFDEELILEHRGWVCTSA
jgi:vacuolar protein sorting-associated protein 3